MKPQIFPRQPQQLGIIRQYMVSVSACLALAAAGSSVAWPSPTLPRIINNEAPFFLSFSDTSWMVSSFYLGSLTSPIPAQYLADKFGRKRSLLCSGFVPIISWLLILRATEPLALFVARYLAGVQFGLVSTIQPIYIGEITQFDCKNTLKPLNNFMFGAGNLLTLVVGPFVSYSSLALVSILFPLLFLLSFLYMPESPYYSLMKDRSNEARESLFWLRGGLNRIELETEFNQIERFVKTQMINTSCLKDILLSRSSKKAMVIGIVFSALRSLSGTYTILAFATLTLPEFKFLGVLNLSSCLILLGITSIFSSLFAPFLAEKYDHKILLVVSVSGCCLSLFTISTWFILESKINITNSSHIIPFVGLLLHNTCYYFMCNQIDVIFKDDIFPANLKIKTYAISTTVFASVSFLTNKFYLDFAIWEGMYLNYAIFFISCIAATLFVFLYVPETKGKTVQEIQDVLCGVERCRITTPVLSRTF